MFGFLLSPPVFSLSSQLEYLLLHNAIHHTTLVLYYTLPVPLPHLLFLLARVERAEVGL